MSTLLLEWLRFKWAGSRIIMPTMLILPNFWLLSMQQLRKWTNSSFSILEFLTKINIKKLLLIYQVTSNNKPSIRNETVQRIMLTNRCKLNRYAQHSLTIEMLNNNMLQYNSSLPINVKTCRPWLAAKHVGLHRQLSAVREHLRTTLLKWR